jgi:hypothetical protein
LGAVTGRIGCANGAAPPEDAASISVVIVVASIKIENMLFGLHHLGLKLGIDEQLRG